MPLKLHQKEQFIHLTQNKITHKITHKQKVRTTISE